MPLGAKGQEITFAIVQDTYEHYSRYVWVHVHPGDTIAKICAERGVPHMASEVANLNGVRHVYQNLLRSRKYPHGLRIHRIRLPGTIKRGDQVSVLADDPPPIVKDGYATFDVVSVPGRKGISRFTGFNPVSLDIPVQWEQWDDRDADGSQVEAEITTIERMAGRRPYEGPVDVPPPVLRLSVTGAHGHVIPLIPLGYQWMPQAMGMLYRISAIAWDPNPKRRPNGKRVSQKAVVTVTEYTPVKVAERSASKRSRQRNTGKSSARS